jgi:uncharacterized protein YutE (UPF0331/DUF86 family)
MTLQTIERKHQRLREVAREYRQRGYEVLIEPRSDQLPEFLAPFRVDMLARSTDENVIVEVRTQESLTDAPELDAIAQALHNQPSWRFELVVTNPRDRASLLFKNATSLNQLDITYRLREARQLSDQEHGEAALLLAWSATEALLRYIAATEAIPVAQHNPSQITKSLFTYGVLDKEQYQTLQDGLHARDMVVHGYKERQSLARTVEQLLLIADQLQSRYLPS